MGNVDCSNDASVPEFPLFARKHPKRPGYNRVSPIIFYLYLRLHCLLHAHLLLHILDLIWTIEEDAALIAVHYRCILSCHCIPSGASEQQLGHIQCGVCLGFSSVPIVVCILLEGCRLVTFRDNKKEILVLCKLEHQSARG